MTKTILVVEDNPDMRTGLQVSLEIEDYSVVTANDGEEALALLATFVPDLILADLKMPHMDGLQLLDEIRKNEAWVDIPVIIVTAVMDPTIQSDIKDRGVHAYITKPFKLVALLDAVAEAVSGL